MALIYSLLSFVDSSNQKLRFPGASAIDHAENGKKRPLRIHFQWESTANDYTATQLEWLRHIDAEWSYRATSDVFAPYRYLNPFLETLLFTNHTTSTPRRGKLAVWVRRSVQAREYHFRYFLASLTSHTRITRRILLNCIT